ncbi:hypothetical protein [Microbacterium thalassium]|uniref:Uncharacterized protein n=1 Tax=Microbacterium thalassium TaxID=362649 RepID=A0A7X0KUG6_9MICO|nr:hypothetical protein [Microbacterium thalassium]MBB6391156.1 hypothetical protein [Microbacterium thalassium]GLK23733.1 hypothetical protein GCM10017607_10510 [Microbacterium thalassium]
MASPERTEPERRGWIAVAIAVGLLVVGAALAIAFEGLLRFRSDIGGPQDLLTWLSRGLLALALAWLVIGMLSARTSLVRRPGAAAARATWIAATRPWRARESALGVLPFDRVLMLTVPVGLLVGTRLLQASFTAWAELAAVVAGWLVFALVVRLLVGRESPWPVIVALGGGIVLHSTLVLIALSIAGPAAMWGALAASTTLRILASAVSLGAFGWILVAGAWSLVEQLGLRRAWATVAAGAGAGLAVTAALVAGAGFGPASPFAIPQPTPWVAATVGVLLFAVGAIVALVRPRSK